MGPGREEDTAGFDFLVERIAQVEAAVCIGITFWHGAQAGCIRDVLKPTRPTPAQLMTEIAKLPLAVSLQHPLLRKHNIFSHFKGEMLKGIILS